MGLETLNELRAGSPLQVGGVTIVPLEERRATVSCGGSRVFASAGMAPAGIVILDGRGVRALDSAGQELEMDDLVRRAVGLRELLQG